MNNDLLNILSNSNKDIDNQKLMDYLSGKLSPKEQQEIEQLMAGSDFMNDAVEGLQHFNNKKDILKKVGELNASLQKNLQKKKERRQKRRLKEAPLTYFAILLILLLCICGYLIVRAYLHSR